MSIQFDLLIIGGGPAGYSAAIHAAHSARQLRIGLIEAGPLGGTCLNRGCIPTKTFLETVRVLEEIQHASDYGINLDGAAAPNLPKIVSNKDRIVKRMAAGIGQLLQSSGVSHITATARVERADAQLFQVKAVYPNGNEETFNVPKLILATGSAPAQVPIPGLELPEVAQRVLTSDDLLDPKKKLQAIPTRLAILGGGVVGVEMARICQAFGTEEVTLIEAMPQLLPNLDGELVEELQKALHRRRIRTFTGTKVQKVHWTGSELQLTFDNDQKLECTHLLLATGRKPVTDFLSPELLAQLKPAPNGFLPVDTFMETQVKGLFAPGDLNGKCMLAHAAMEMGRLAAIKAVESSADCLGSMYDINESLIEEYRRRILEPSGDSELPSPGENFFPFFIPGCVYGEPEIGYIGWTEAEARKRLDNKIRVGRFPFAANGRAAAAGHREGFVKVILTTDKEERIAGVHIIGPGAAELINEVSSVMCSGGNVERWIRSIHAHPTFGESLIEAASTAQTGFTLHLPVRR